MAPSTPASLPATPANIDQPVKPVEAVAADAASAEWARSGGTAYGKLLEQYGSLAVSFNNLRLWGLCVIAQHNDKTMPKNCPAPEEK